MHLILSRIICVVILIRTEKMDTCGIPRGWENHGEIPTLLLTIPDLHGIAGQDGAGDSDCYPGKGITVLGGSR